MQDFGKFPKKAESAPRTPSYEFGTFTLNPLKRIVLNGHEPIPLTSKCFDILLVLLEHRDEVVVKEELMELVWPDTAVEEGNLNRHVSTIRKLLGESPHDHRYIVTVPGRGYRFVAEVKEVLEEKSAGIRHETRGSGEGVEIGPDAQGKKGVVQPISVSAPSIVRPATVAHRSFLRTHYAWAAGGAVVCLLGLATVFGLGLRRKPVVSGNDPILIADFSNSTGDVVFDDSLKQAVSVDLSQSPYLNILSETKVNSILRLMTKPPETRLTGDVARDLCQRAGGKAYIAGSIAQFGEQYMISLNAVECRSGDSLAQEQVVAKSKEQVLEALDQTTAKLRNRLGESLSSLNKFDTPLGEATTPSLEALKAFSLGNKARDTHGEAATIPFFQRAIELDPNFALAYDALGVTYSNLDEPGLASENITKAHNLRSHVSERERLQIDADYSQIVSGELEKVNEVSELWARTYPQDDYPHNLLGVNYEFLGKYGEAIKEMSEAVRLNPDGVVLRSDLMEDYTALNRLDEAKETYRLALERNLDHPYLHADLYGVAFLENDREEMDKQLAWASGRPGAEDLLLSVESDTRAFFGNLGKAREYSDRAVVVAKHAHQSETAALWQMNAAIREAEFGNFARARKDITAALAIARTRDVQILAALALARTGDSGRAEKMAADLTQRYPDNSVVNGYWLPTIRAAIQINRGNPARAVDMLRASVPYELGYPDPQVGVGKFLYPAYLRGQAYLLLHRGNEAAAEYKKFPDYRSIVENCPLGALSQLGLARASLLQGDQARARTHYQKFLILWEDADPDIPIFIMAKAEYAKLQ